MDIKKEIKDRERTIMLLGYDVIGSNAFSNVERMKILRQEIANLKRYGKPNPNILQLILATKPKGDK